MYSYLAGRYCLTKKSKQIQLPSAAIKGHPEWARLEEKQSFKMQHKFGLLRLSSLAEAEFTFLDPNVTHCL